MHKKLFILVAGLALLIAACAPKTPAAVPTAAATQVAPAPTETVLGTECTVVSLMPTPGPTEVSLFPVAGPEEWVRGPTDAAVTFLEYSDFQ